MTAGPEWTASGDYDDVRFGYSVSTAGDVNLDGTNDIIVAPGPGGGPRVQVYDGVTGDKHRQKPRAATVSRLAEGAA